MTPPLSRDLRSPCGLPAARLSGKPKQKDSENGKALKNRGLRGSKRIYRNFVAVLWSGLLLPLQRSGRIETKNDNA